MRIAIKCRSILKPHLTGIGRNSFHLLECLGLIDQTNQYALYCPKRFYDFKRPLPQFKYKNFTVKPDFFNQGPKCTIGTYDLYHIPSPDDVPDSSVPVIVTVHDLIYKTYAQSHTAETISLTARYMESIIKKAAKIICTSESTRNDLHHYFNFPKERSCLVYNGVDHDVFFQLTEEDKGIAQNMLTDKGIKGPFILSVGTLEPRKNLSNVLKAMAVLKQKKQFQGQLVVIGAGGWKMEGMQALIASLGIESQVLFLGYVSDQELRCFYNLATAFVYPSFYEGFGFPIIESFACGAAVVTSNVSSCPEIASSAALTVDPSSPEAIAQALASIVQDPILRNDLKQKALVRAKDFSFIKTAQETLKVYEEAHAR